MIYLFNYLLFILVVFIKVCIQHLLVSQIITQSENISSIKNFVLDKNGKNKNEII